MTDEQKILVKKALFGLKGALMTMDINAMSDSQLEEAFNAIQILPLPTPPTPQIPMATDETVGGIKTGWTLDDALLAPAGFTTDNNGKLAMSMASVENSADFSTVMSLTEFNINVFALNADVQDVLAP